ncbi:MAG: hypothetical protein KTR16_03360 [Acidiferrobacterales bacterium]|nr:hypothetical protein [Acidiferrobacterales bacterium]
MRLLIYIFLGAAAGIAALNIGKVYPDNYIKVYIANYLIEVKLVPFLILLLLIVVSLYFVMRLLRMLMRSGSLFSNWRQKKSKQTAQAALGSGYLSLIKGDWSRAEKSLTTKCEHSGLPYVNYLAAAQAAQEQGKIISRDEYLNAAYKAAPAERFAIGLTKARLHQKAGQLDQALATLQDIAPDGAKNAQYTAMLMQTYEQMNNWQGIEGLLPAARKQKALPEAVLEKMLHDVHSHALPAASDKKTAWNNLTSVEKKNPENVALYATYLMDNGQHDEAEKLIRGALKSNYDDRLVAIYGAIESSSPAKLRRAVEGWLLARPESAQLNLAAGRFALAENNIELAKTYLHNAIDQGQLSLAYSLLGDIYENIGQSGEALKLYRSGMVAASKSESALLAQDTNHSNALIGDLVN